MLRTNLNHIETDEAFQELLDNHENVMLCCGREGPMCLPVYDVMENIESRYPHVTFRDMHFDGWASHNIRSLPQVRGFTGLPFTVYFKNGEVVAATSSIQSKKQVREQLDRAFGREPNEQAA